MKKEVENEYEESNLRLEDPIYSTPTIFRVKVTGNKPKDVKTVDLESMTATTKQIETEEESYNAGQAAVNNRIFQIGGLPHMNKCWEIFPNIGDIKPISGLIVGRQYLACEVVCTGREIYIYVVGGQGVKGKFLKECEKYVLSQDLWVTVPPLNDSRSSIGLTQFNNQFRDVIYIYIYIIVKLIKLFFKHLIFPTLIEYLYTFGGVYGGFLGIFSGENKIERLHLDKYTKKWEKLNIKHNKGWTSRINAGCVQINSESILVFGGYYDNNMFNDTFLFNVKTLSMIKLSQNLVEKDSFLFSTNPSIYGERMAVFGIIGSLHIYNFEH